MNKRKVCALGMAFVLAGCSAGGSGSVYRNEWRFFSYVLSDR